MPPIPPTATAQEVAAVFQNNTTGIRAGLMLIMLGFGFSVPIAAVIFVHMRRIEGSNSVLAYSQLLSNGFGAILGLVPILLWCAVAFRPERDPELMQLLNDLAWICFIFPVTFLLVQNLSIALAIFSDSGEKKIFPRWVGFFNVWIALLFLPGSLVIFFQTGPFAWDGILAFWLAIVIFSSWFLVMVPVLLKVIREQESNAISDA